MRNVFAFYSYVAIISCVVVGMMDLDVETVRLIEDNHNSQVPVILYLLD